MYSLFYYAYYDITFCYPNELGWNVTNDIVRFFLPLEIMRLTCKSYIVWGFLYSYNNLFVMEARLFLCRNWSLKIVLACVCIDPSISIQTVCA